MAPDQSVPPQSAMPDQSGASTQVATPDQSATTAPAPVKHHHRMRHVTNATDTSGTGSDHWAHQPGTGQSGPASMRASNIDAADTHSDIAPHFPEPAVGPGASPESLLQAAQAAISSHRTGTAQQALEMAETRLLDRSTPVGSANQPDDSQRVAAVASARKALASGDTHGAEQAIQMAMASGSEGMGQGSMSPAPGTPPGGQAPAQPMPGPQ
jgi:hypothetical protein